MSYSFTAKFLVWGSVVYHACGLPAAQAQKSRIEDQFIWYSQSLTVPLSAKWTLLQDGSVRWYGNHRNISFLIMRVGLEYKLTKTWSVAGGYTFFDQLKDMEGLPHQRSENRLFQQAIVRRSIGIFTWQNRFRVEERFFTEYLRGEHVNYHYYRFRNMMALQVSPFKKGFLKKWYVTAQAELMYHAGDKKYVLQPFDQYRLYSFVGMKVNECLDLHAGYMYYYQINPANTLETLGHTLRISIGYAFKRKEKRASPSTDDAF